MPVAAFVPAIIGGVAAVGSAAMAKSAQNKAVNAQTAMATQNNQLAQSIHDQNVGLAQPMVDQGSTAQQRILDLLGLGSNPEAAQNGFADFLRSTNYQFQYDQGQRAITSTRAASGLLQSGSTLKALTDYGQNAGRSALGGYMDQLGNIATRGLAGVQAVTGANNTLLTTQTSNNQGAADAVSNGALQGGTTGSNLLQQLASLGSTAFGQSSYSQPKSKSVYAI